eukprot:scaffold61119_cov37-Phaeocystis_antarctica.AAC.1
MPSRRRRGRRPSSMPCSAPITELVVAGDCAVGQRVKSLNAGGWCKAGGGWDGTHRLAKSRRTSSVTAAVAPPMNAAVKSTPPPSFVRRLIVVTRGGGGGGSGLSDG